MNVKRCGSGFWSSVAMVELLQALISCRTSIVSFSMYESAYLLPFLQIIKKSRHVLSINNTIQKVY